MRNENAHFAVACTACIQNGSAHEEWKRTFTPGPACPVACVGRMRNGTVRTAVACAACIKNGSAYKE
eukprot:scaffold61756_cov18-Tisochrysis_lutea.AAC.2